MDRKKIIVAFGTRPEAIKMAPLIRRLSEKKHQFDIKVCITAQHREMLDQVLEIFKIRPDTDLDIMKPEQDLDYLSSSIISKFGALLKVEKPALLLVHGDTITSTMCAFSAFLNHVPVGHVEAGLRTYNVMSPWPEEMNRQLTGRIAKYHFAPTISAFNNLREEKVAAKNIFITGNTVIDALFDTVKLIKSDSAIRQNIEKKLSSQGYKPDPTDKNRRLVVITGHRRENFGQGFLNICNAIKKLSELFPDVDFVYPVHLNPNVQKPVIEILKPDQNTNIFLLNPLDYLSFVYLMEKSYLILTDSGGIQEEAPSLNKPVLVMRDTTERPEAIEAGTAVLVGTNYDSIVNKTSELLNNSEAYTAMASKINPFGNGTASNKIVDILTGLLK